MLASLRILLFNRSLGQINSHIVRSLCTFCCTRVPIHMHLMNGMFEFTRVSPLLLYPALFRTTRKITRRLGLISTLIFSTIRRVTKQAARMWKKKISMGSSQSRRFRCVSSWFWRISTLNSSQWLCFRACYCTVCIGFIGNRELPGITYLVVINAVPSH